MKPTASELRARARVVLKGNWGIAIFAAFVASLLGGAGTSFSGTSGLNIKLPTKGDTLPSSPPGEVDLEILTLLLLIFGTALLIGLVIGIAFHLFGGIIELGYCSFRLELLDKGISGFEKLFSYFKYWKVAVLSRFLIGLYTFLWSLLFIIPGIVAAYSYAMTPFILAENPELSASEAMRRSKEMMDGNKWRLFCLGVSFVGWSFLCSLTFGIGYLWLNPYTHISIAAFYRDLVPLPVVEEPVIDEIISDFHEA